MEAIMRPDSILALLFTAVVAVAQVDTGEVSGRVVSSRNNEPLGLVQVQLQLPGTATSGTSNTTFRTVTGADGKFSIAGVPPGNYVLQTTTVDYYLVRQEFTLAAGETKNFDVVLTSSMDQRKDTVVVSAGTFGITPEAS